MSMESLEKSSPVTGTLYGIQESAVDPRRNAMAYASRVHNDPRDRNGIAQKSDPGHHDVAEVAFGLPVVETASVAYLRACAVPLK